MGLETINWADVLTFLSGFFGTAIVSGIITAAIGLGLGGLALAILIGAFRN